MVEILIAVSLVIEVGRGMRLTKQRYDKYDDENSEFEWFVKDHVRLRFLCMKYESGVVEATDLISGICYGSVQDFYMIDIVAEVVRMICGTVAVSDGGLHERGGMSRRETAMSKVMVSV